MNPNYAANSSIMSNTMYNPIHSNTIPSNSDGSEGLANNVTTALNQFSNMTIHNQYEKKLNSSRDLNTLNGQMANKQEVGSIAPNFSQQIPASSVPGVMNGNFVNANFSSDNFLPPQPLGNTLQNQSSQQPGTTQFRNSENINTHAGFVNQVISNTSTSQGPFPPSHLTPQGHQMTYPPVQVSTQNFLPPGQTSISQKPGAFPSQYAQGGPLISNQFSQSGSTNPQAAAITGQQESLQVQSNQVSTQSALLPPQQGIVMTQPTTSNQSSQAVYQTNQTPSKMGMLPPRQNNVQPFGYVPPKVNSIPGSAPMQNQQAHASVLSTAAPPRAGNAPLQQDGSIHTGHMQVQSDQSVQHASQQPLAQSYGNLNHPYNQQAQAKNMQFAQPRGQIYPMQGGFAPSHAGYPSPAYPSQNNPYQQPQQARRLDPDQMPSPIQVTNDDQKARGGVFATDQKGAVPPLVTTSFIVQDQGNASPRYIRSSMYNVATTSDMMKQTSVPFGLIISPFAKTLEQELVPPIVNLGELGPVRCVRCKAYMCPFMQFIDSGRRFQCLFCTATTDVPNEYFQHLDQYGLRMDRYERPELMLGTYEFVATKDYCRNNEFPKPPAIIFVIDVSYNNIKSGLVNLLCAEMKNIIKNLPIDQGQNKTNMKVGFITYNNTVHFYNIKHTLAQPQMLVVGDIQEMFMPLLDGFLCDPEDSDVVIDTLMQQIPAMFADTRETETILAPAIEAGLAALKASECTGKLLIFHSTLPVADAPGKLKNRDDRKLLGTDKEKSILTPQCNDYTKLGQECVSAGCSVDLFLFNNSFIDIATIGQITKLTGGEVYKYTYFLAEMDGYRLVSDIIHNISRPIAFDAIMRVRTSTGVRPTDFFGHFYMSNTTDMELASIDCDKAIAIEIKHDDKLSEEEGVYIQVALLYTSCGGQRRLRIINLSLKTCAQMTDLYRSCDLDTIINYFSKQAMTKMLESTPKAYKEDLVNRCAQILACYRKNCASPSSAGQLILPECMKLLPLYMNCLLKSDALSGGADMTVDDRSFVMQAVMTMDLPSSVVYFYPRLISLHDLSPHDTNVPLPMRCSIDKMVDDGAYLLENGIHMFLWLGLGLNQEWVQAVFGVPTCAQIDTDKVVLPTLENPISERVRNVVNSVRKQRHRCMRLTLVRQRDKLEPVCKHFLVEDRGTDGSSSYVDFLCHMHKEIRMLLS